MELTLYQDDLEKLHAAKRILEKDFKSHYTTEQLAEKVGMNDCKLKSGFRQLFQISPYKLLLVIRVEKAKDVLSCKEYPLKYIAASTGFTDVHTFIKNFKRLTGISPKQWRRSVRKQSKAQFSGIDNISSEFDNSVELYCI